MSTTEENIRAPREPLFSKKNKRLVTDPLADNNPITIQVLGICYDIRKLGSFFIEKLDSI